MKETFTYSGDHEYATWHKGVECSICRINGDEHTEAIGVIIDALGPDSIVAPDTIQVTPTCEECADGTVVRFLKGGW